jgi:hypothetical protein
VTVNAAIYQFGIFQVIRNVHVPATGWEIDTKLRNQV